MTLSPNLIQPYLYESPIERDFVGREIKEKNLRRRLDFLSGKVLVDKCWRTGSGGCTKCLSEVIHPHDHDGRRAGRQGPQRGNLRELQTPLSGSRRIC